MYQRGGSGTWVVVEVEDEVEDEEQQAIQLELTTLLTKQWQASGDPFRYSKAQLLRPLQLTIVVDSTFVIVTTYKGLCYNL